MAAQRGASGIEKKKRSKKRKTRTEVSSSSESDSDVSSVKSQKVAAVEEETKDVSPAPAPAPAKKEKKKKSKTGSAPEAQPDEDVAMTDVPASPPPKQAASKASQQAQDDFGALYLRKIAAEFADDLDKVREAPDFKASSVPMLIHALKQGESLYSVEERKRVVGAANA
ncbi:hypothetical protein J4E90_000540 [Alternaria incomplexa]|uniref:uncharacterized protein n=1 Tax=Alternaria incomplexa TaxID=1187928 RepID=UPI00221F9E47|nr:uncharacterized protein J4E90_000540 [Alternaria incomplexa]XP_051305219.1 uncharacterized protein J4E86_003168 [Alternaria arbusti]KAI4922112.1 hypothetical protein J4E90_000540 [Alternaria incomplexa]KAI4959446.1 hypothetical protein J4E86_003168 [Alternaria arbusti]